MEPHSQSNDRRTPRNGGELLGSELGSAAASLAVPTGGSLAEMAQRDLDAALQLLAHRAQYITGASGVAIALRREGKDDMLCRASTGSNAPELGALFSTELGLSGESVRTRQALRCDDAEVDARVNRDVCRQMGIASVVVMPVVNDDEVLGVFELFSGKANAFGARDVSAVQRLSEMVETAVRLARATQSLPERLKRDGISGPGQEDSGDLILEESDSGTPVAVEGSTSGAEALEEQGSSIAALEALRHPKASHPEAAYLNAAHPNAGDPNAANPNAAHPNTAHPNATYPNTTYPNTTHPNTIQREAPHQQIPHLQGSLASPESSVQEKRKPMAAGAEIPTLSQSARKDGASIAGVAPAVEALSHEEPKKALFWSAALNPAGDGEKSEEADQSHVPPVLRSLRKCEACGFPVSAGRALCVECEEKKWRGQLGVPKAGAVRPAAAVSEVGTAVANPEARAFAAAASAPTLSPVRASGAGTSAATPQIPATELKDSATPSLAVLSAAARETVVPTTDSASPAEFVLSAGLEASQSWLARNKYMVGVLLAIGAAVAAIFLLR